MEASLLAQRGLEVTVYILYSMYCMVVAVVGAGLVGSLEACLLAQRGLEVTVYILYSMYCIAYCMCHR